MNWIDKSDSRSRFFTAEKDAEITGDSFTAFVDEVLSFVLNHILTLSPSKTFDTLYVESSCAAGWILVSPATEAERERGTHDGCAVNLKKLSDCYYDLRDADGPSDAFFQEMKKVQLRIGRDFESGVRRHLEAFTSRANGSPLTLIVFGSEPGEILLKLVICG